MNLHSIVAGQISSVNPFLLASVQISTAQGATTADGLRAPAFATPGSITASIAGDVLTVSAIAQGTLLIGQALADLTAALLPGTSITDQLTGAPGGVGTYTVSRAQTVASETMTTALILRAQVQPMTWRDLQQVSGLNLQGTRRKIYLFGRVDGIVRVLHKGGDLITIAPGGVNDGVYLCTQVLEQWPDWVSVAAVLQDGV
jgi:hypothetical protein